MPVRKCKVCGQPLMRRKNESDWNFKRRKICGRACLGALIESRWDRAGMAEPSEEYKAMIEARIAEVRPSFVGADLE